MGTGKKKTKSLRDELIALLNEEDYRRQMLLAVVEKAIGGDMKAFETVRAILNEPGQTGETGVVVTLGNGIEELAK